MKLSEAILFGGMATSQCKLVPFIGDASCALGGAALALGFKRSNESRTIDVLNYLNRLFPGYSKTSESCPGCGQHAGSQRGIFQIIWHLNDAHEWSRDRIAEWVASVEPQDPTESQMRDAELRVDAIMGGTRSAEFLTDIGVPA